MIRVSDGPIRISKTTEDRWGRIVPYWSVNPWGYIGFDQFMKIRHFEEKPSKIPFLLEQEITHKLKFSYGTTVYQFNAVPSIKKYDYIRMCAVMNGGNVIQYCSWFDAYVKYPLLEAICDIANRIVAKEAPT